MKGLIAGCMLVSSLAVYAAVYPVINNSFFNIKLGQNITTLKNYLESKDIVYLKEFSEYAVVPDGSIALSNTLFLINRFPTESGEPVKMKIEFYNDQVMDVTVNIPFAPETLQDKVELYKRALVKKYGNPYSVKGTGIQTAGYIVFRKPYSALSVLETQNKYVNIKFAYSYNNSDPDADFITVSYSYEDIMTNFEQYLKYRREQARSAPDTPAKRLIDEL